MLNGEIDPPRRRDADAAAVSAGGRWPSPLPRRPLVAVGRAGAGEHGGRAACWSSRAARGSRTTRCSSASERGCTSSRATASASQEPAPGVTNPVWVDDDGLRPRLARAPRRRPADELDALVGHELSRRLDRSRPLWELTVVDGLAGRPRRARAEDAPRARRRRRGGRHRHGRARPDARADRHPPPDEEWAPQALRPPPPPRPARRDADRRARRS